MTAPHIERMNAELTELDDRTEKLASFISGNPIFENLEQTDADLLRAQNAAMEAYRGILTIRLARAVVGTEK